MLYITTRDNRDAFTAYRALHESIAPDGGAYIPFRMPVFTAEEIAAFGTGSFGQTVAEILNRFFSGHLSGWDVDFCIGRNAVNLVTMPHRIAVAELWHNPDGVYDHICSSLFQKLSGTVSNVASEWFLLASHISVLFGLYGELCHSGVISYGDTFDITTIDVDFTVPLAAIYARQMGLPIDMIIITSVENSGLWDILHLGELNLAVESANAIAYERLVHATLGDTSVAALCSAMLAKKTFRIDSEQLMSFNRGLFCAVTGKDRSAQNVNSIYRSNSYILDPMAALSIGGLQDYRAKTGESKLTLVLSCTSPMNCVSQISDATGISPEKLTLLLKNPQDRR